MKYLGIDFGIKRVGLALSSPDEKHVFPFCTLERTTRSAFFESLLDLIEKEKIEAVVIGLPLRQDNSESLTTAQVRNFGNSLRRRITLPIFLVNEYLSSFEAEERMSLLNIPLYKRKELADQIAAQCILESFLFSPSTPSQAI